MLQATQSGAVHMDKMTQKGNSAGGRDGEAGVPRSEQRPWLVPVGPQAQKWCEGVTGKGKCWSRKNMKKAGD